MLTYLKAFAALFLGLSQWIVSAAPNTVEARLESLIKIGDTSAHNAFTDLIYWHQQWWCVYREGTAHVSPDGAVRLLNSTNGTLWTPVHRLTSSLGDLRDPHLAIAPNDRLMIYGAVALTKTSSTTHQSLAWYSSGGTDWTPESPIGEPNVWLWRIAWKNETALGIGYDTVKEGFVRLYTSKGGRPFEPLVSSLYSEQKPNESGIVFLPDATALCLLRRDGEPGSAKLGESHPPYREWKWKELGIRIGGPQLLRLPDGRLIAGVRLYDGGTRMSLCTLDLTSARLTEFLKLPSGGDCSYPGMVWQQDRLWVSYYSSHEGKSCVYLARIRLL